jgi:hypothetical protein
MPSTLQKIVFQSSTLNATPIPTLTIICVSLPASPYILILILLTNNQSLFFSAMRMHYLAPAARGPNNLVNLVNPV